MSRMLVACSGLLKVRFKGWMTCVRNMWHPISDEFFVRLDHIRKCFTQKGGIFVLEEYSKPQDSTSDSTQIQVLDGEGVEAITIEHDALAHTQLHPGLGLGA
uniref:MAP kinase-activating death domain-containing protein n=1 Tax=Timema genevievae TaxID=629358 RepID=A0A7R9JY01_TIMGE|nr:unnamed protein product [Timema genevievae]